MTERELLAGMAARYRARRGVAGALLVAGAAGCAIAAGRFLPQGATIVVVAGAMVAAVAVAIRAVAAAPGAASIARHLDRVDPGLEESAELLLADEAALGIADRLERARAARAFSARPPTLGGLPDAAARRMAAAGGIGLLAALALSTAPSPGSDAAAGPGDPGGTRAPGGAPRVRGVSITVEPPRYTGLPARRQEDWELDVVEGSRITWSVGLDRAVGTARLAFGSGDSVALSPGRSARLEGSAVARASALYHFVHDDVAGDYHRIVVRQDAPPSVTVLRPAPRTTIAPDGSRRVQVEALVRDDFGIGAASLVATVTTGDGEGVRFREQLIALGPGTRARGGTVFRRILDLDSLGMAPGDELYFHAVARDRRAPGPNEGRSETVFIALADTGGRMAAGFAGLALATLPEYFRSQRQIIIDTERLIADSTALPADVFRERANAIGMDQGLLRLRYGQFAGEEFESEVEADEAHQHDSEENATLLAPATKTALQAAIAQMWEAELRLRTYRPRGALPYEYRALELLKSAQAQSRAYVQRVGFEPPPLDPARTRLTGKLDAVRSRAVADTVEPPPRQPAVSAALDRARALAGGRPATRSDAATFDEAAAEIARQAVPPSAGDAADQLDAIRAVRALAASLRMGSPCPGCAAAAMRALAGRMERAPPAAFPRAPGSALAHRYLDLIDTP